MVAGVVIDKLYPGQIGGAEQYVRNIVSALEQMDETELVLFLNSTAMESFCGTETGRIRKICVPDQLTRPTEYYEYYIEKYHIEVMFCPLFYVPYEYCSVPTVTSVLDIQYEYYPEYFTAELLNYRRRETKRAIDISTEIITISEFSRDTIIEKLKVEKEKISVIYQNSDGSFEKEINEKKQEIRNRLPEQYIFYPANGWAHKNHKKLIDAYEILRKKYTTECSLVLTGNSFQDENGLQKYILEKGLEKDVVNLGYITQEEMPYVFLNARMLVFPSLFEGFGIPLVEAMRTGTPITCSHCGSIPEIVDDAALFFDAFDEKDIACKMHLLDQDESLRNRLRKKGFLRAQRFSWTECARQTWKVLERCAVKRKNRKVFLPQITFFLPVFEKKDGIGETVGSIQRQAYPRKNVVIFGRNRRFLEELKRDERICVANVEVVLQVEMENMLYRYIEGNENGIIGILQAGYVFDSSELLEQIFFTFADTLKDVLWIMPKKAGFWGEFLKNGFGSEKNHKLIQLDKAAYSIPFFRGGQRKLLEKMEYWFDGYYQQNIMGKLLSNDTGYTYMYQESVRLVDIKDMKKTARYKRAVRKLWKQNQYVSPEFVSKKWEIRIRGRNQKTKAYYTQILSRSLEFDGIAADGWMSKEYEFEVNISEKSNCLRIIGENNVLGKQAFMSILIDQQEIAGKVVVEEGEFIIDYALPDEMQPGWHQFRLLMNRTVSCYDGGEHRDIRALSIRICLLSINNNVIWKLQKEQRE